MTYDPHMSVDVGIVVITYNSSDSVGALLDSIPAAMGDLSAETVVVDNRSTDGTADFVEERGDVRVIRASNDGYAAGFNVGVQALSSCPALLVLNPDLELHPGSVAVMRSALRPGVGVVAPRVLDEHGDLTRSLRNEPTILRATGLSKTGWEVFDEYVRRPEKYAYPRNVDWALGAALLVDRACYERVGGWDETFFLYSEETDFCLRARDLGWRTRYEPAAVVSHVGGGSGRSARTHAMQVVNRVRLYRRRHRLIPSIAYHATLLASEASWILRGHPESRAAVKALLRSSARPTELGASGSLMKRVAPLRLPPRSSGTPVDSPTEPVQ